MPWYLPWSESIKKRACRYLLQRYLGQFLEEKLTLDQLTVDLYNGIGSVSHVKLDVQALNELGEQQNLPVEFVDGYISEMSVSIPWSSLLKDASYVEVKGLMLTIQPKQRADTGASMFESVWSSMSSSMQLAEECLRGEEQEKETAQHGGEQGQPLEGLELFAQAIDSILSRVKVKFVETRIRLEHVPKGSATGVALELRIHSLDYFDECGAGEVPPAEGEEAEGSSRRLYCVAAIASKGFHLEGVTLWADEFPAHARTFSRSVMSLSIASSPADRPSDNVLDSPVSTECPLELEGDTMGCSQHSNCSSGSYEAAGGGGSNVLLEPDPVPLGRLTGRQEVRLRLRQRESAGGAKVQLEAQCGALILFLSPRQWHLATEVVAGLSQPHTQDCSNVPSRRPLEKPMGAMDFCRVERELQQKLRPVAYTQSVGVRPSQGWSTAALGESEEEEEEDEEEEEFLPMGGMMAESGLSLTSSVNSSVCSTASSCSKGPGNSRERSSGRAEAEAVAVTVVSSLLPSLSFLCTASLCRYATPCASMAPMHATRRRTHKGGGGAGNSVGAPAGGGEVSHFRVRLSAVAAVLLHEDLLTACAPASGATPLTEAVGGLARSSVQQMKDTADSFFKALGRFGCTPFGWKEVPAARGALEAATTLSHLRLLAANVAVEGAERSSVSAGGSVSVEGSAQCLEVVERLVEAVLPSQAENVELLAFQEVSGEGRGEPCVRVHWESTTCASGATASAVCESSEVRVALAACRCEADVSIVDRVSALLQPQLLCGRASHMAALEQAADRRTKLRITSPFLTIKVRFPTPDLRPLHDLDRPPWWKRHVRKDFLEFELTDALFCTTLDTRDPVIEYELSCKEVHGLFQEADTDVPISFARASATDRNGNPLSSGTTPPSTQWASSASASVAGGGERPRLVVTVAPVPSGGAAEDEEAMDQDSDRDSDGGNPGDGMGSETQATSREPSPFSGKRVVHESDTPHRRTQGSEQQQQQQDSGEELIIPGDRREMRSFVQSVQSRVRIRIDVSLPCASVLLSSKHLYEVLYNRLNTDMLLWEPSAPRPPPSAAGKQSEALASLLQEAFSMCKSAVHYESDSDSSDGEGMLYTVYDQWQRTKRRQVQAVVPGALSHTALALSIGQGALTVCAPVRDSGGNVIPGQHGELLLQLQEGNLFSVSGFKGQTGLGFICLQVEEVLFLHNGLVSPPRSPPLPSVGGPSPPHLLPTVSRSVRGVQCASLASGGNSAGTKEAMLSVAIRVRLEDSVHTVKTFRVAAAVRGATLRHRTVPSAHSWFTQFVDFFDVNDYPIAGYDPPGVITELQLHLWDCCVDYRPVHLPLRSVLHVGSFSVASNIAAHTSTSTLRFIAEEAMLFLSDKVPATFEPSVIDLQRDYVCIMDLGLFELSLRLCSQQSTNAGVPRVDLRASNNVLHLRTCADSAKALTDLLTYFASDGDLRPKDEEGVSQERSCAMGEPLAQVSPGCGVDRGSGHSAALSQAQVEQVNALMEEAMKESITLQHAGPPKASPRRGERGVEVFFFPDEAKSQKALADSELFQREEAEGESSEDGWEHDFCILDKETGSGFLPKNSLPEVRLLSSEPLRLVENHFSVPLGRRDLLKAPKGFPPAVLRYTLCEMTVVWHMYGGNDFGPPSSIPSTAAPSSNALPKQPPAEQRNAHSLPASPPALSSRPEPCFPSDSVRRPLSGTHVAFSKASPQQVHFQYTPPRGSRATSPQELLFQAPPQQPLPWQLKGGPGRRHDILMELQLNKVRFQHEEYPETSPQAARQVLLVSELELRDRLASSNINKFLHHYTSEARPKQSHANMIVVKAVHVRPDPKLPVQECSLKVSLLPLRLHIDQDALLFLCQFFSDVSGRKASTESAAGGSHGGGENCSASPAHLPPVMTVHPPAPLCTPAAAATPSEPQALLILLEDELKEAACSPAQPQAPHLYSQGGGVSTPVFFRSFVFAPDVPIRLDYQGKRVDLSHGPLAGLIMGLGQLNCSELRLKRLSHRHGLLGVDKLLAFALAEWLRDVKRHQLPWLLGGVGPLPALLQLWSGVRDLFLLPLQQYQRDGRLARGLSSNSNFTSSSRNPLVKRKQSDGISRWTKKF